MIKKEKRTKKIHYKLASVGTGKITLQTYVDLALKKLPKPANRLEHIDTNGLIQRVINSSKKQSNITFGQMILFEKGKDQNIVVINDDITEYPVEQFKIPKRKDGKSQEAIESVLYFGILENHVIVVQSSALRARDLERHLEWLTSQKALVFPKNSAILLSDKPSQEAMKKIERQPIKKVSIGAELRAEPDEEIEKNGLSAKKIKFHPTGDGFEILKAALGAGFIDNLKLEDALEDANLKVSLEVSYFRKTTKRASSVLSNIATAMRHADPDDVRIELDNGTILKGKDIKMSSDITVDTINGIADSNDLYSEMGKWLLEQAQQGTI
jgi:hypothetical protein